MSGSDERLELPEFDQIARLLAEIQSTPPDGLAKLHAPRTPTHTASEEPPPFPQQAIEDALGDLGNLNEFLANRMPARASAHQSYDTAAVTASSPEAALEPTSNRSNAEKRGRIGLLSIREFFQLVNWERDEDKQQAFQDAIYPELAEPPGEEGSVGEVMSGFFWDDDEE